MEYTDKYVYHFPLFFYKPQNDKNCIFDIGFYSN